jgi:N-acyl-D-amino-acid deacylase
MTARTLLRGGLVADGIGTATVRADLLIEGELIEWIGPDASAVGATAENCEVIELEPGSVVLPGFIDAHVHAEGPLLADGVAEGALAQGVTTLVVGQDGESWIGANAATVRYLNQYFGPVNGRLEAARDFSVSDFREAVSGRLVQNVAVLASQGTIRHNIAGLATRPLDREQLAAARRQVEQALADGAAGLSSGLDYLPSRFGSVSEIAEIARPLAEAGRPYVSHLRAYGAGVGAGLGELVAVGREAGVRVHASHLWGAPGDIQAAFDAADAAGVPVTFDMYPYRKSSTILAVLLLPPDVQFQGPEHTVAVLRDPVERGVLLAGEKFAAESLGNLYLGCLPERYGQYAGMSVTEAAGRSSRHPGEWVLDLLADTGLNAGAHLDRPELADEHLDWLAGHQRFSAGSDGIYQGQHPHPRGYGSFARLAGYYLSRSPDTAYQRIGRRLAANAADIYGISGRGRLAAGMAADICVIGPGGLSERASYDAPELTATGLVAVLVNGATAWRNDKSPGNEQPGGTNGRRQNVNARGRFLA